MNQLRKLERLKEAYRNLHSLARPAGELAARGEWEALEDIWAKRSRLFGGITALDAELKPCFEDWQNTLSGMPPSQREKADLLVNEIRHLAQSVLAADEDLKKLLQKEMDAINAQLKRIEQGRKLNRAYSGRAIKKGLAVSLSKLG